MTSEQFDKAIEELKDKAYRDQPDVFSSFISLLCLLAVKNCEHDFITQNRGGDPADQFSGELVTYCVKCGWEKE